MYNNVPRTYLERHIPEELDLFEHERVLQGVYDRIHRLVENHQITNDQYREINRTVNQIVNNLLAEELTEDVAVFEGRLNDAMYAIEMAAEFRQNRPRGPGR